MPWAGDRSADRPGALRAPAAPSILRTTGRNHGPVEREDRLHHRREPRVRAHIFLCMLAYYVEWHLREAWRPLLFADEDQQAKTTRDPVAPAKRSAAALRKVHAKVLADGTVVHSFQTLLKALSTIVHNVCRRRGAGVDEPTFQIVTTPTPQQQRAYDLLKTIPV